MLGIGAPAGWWVIRDRQLSGMATLRAEAYEALQEQSADLAGKNNANIGEAIRVARESQNEVAKIRREFMERWTKLHQRSNDLNVYVSGPERIQPGANTPFQIRTTNQVNRPVPAEVTIRVRDEANKVLFGQDKVAMAGDYRVSLPADLPVKPDSKLLLEVVAQREGGTETQVREELSLVAPVYLAHLTTDKPMYRPGETVHFRSLTLERFSLKPPDEDFRLAYAITNPNGEEIFQLSGVPQLVNETTHAPLLGPDKKPLRGIGAGEFKIDPAAKGGEYTLRVRELNNRFPPQERKFIVNQYENPRLNKELDFTRKSYGPGDEVMAACKVSRAEGGTPVARRPVSASIFIDGKSYDADGKEGNTPLALQTDDKGTVSVRFKLPAKIERGLGSLSVQFNDGANVEALVRPIPIALKKLQIEFFPEGGNLVAGVPNRVYFQARTMLGKPAELKGRVVDQNGKSVVDEVATLNDDKEPGANQGMGLFAFTPQAGRKYELKIETPAGIEGKYALPSPKTEGVVLSVPDAVTKSKATIAVTVFSVERDRNLLVGAYCRGRLMDHQTVTAKKGEATKVELRPASPTGGTYRVTVFEEQEGNANRRQLVPRAERLIYHAPGEQLTLNVTPDHKQYTPGEKVKLSLKSLNEKEKETPSVLLVSVVDKSVITMADEKTARSMPTHFLLTTEVRRPEDLEYADFLVGPHPKASAALDLLLGTQGWRRFAEQNPNEFQQKFGDDAGRLLATIGHAAPKAVNLGQLEMEKLQHDFSGQMAKWQAKANESGASLRDAQSGAAFREEMNNLSAALAKAREEMRPSQTELSEHREFGKRASSLLVFGFFGVLAAFCVVRMVAAFYRKVPRAFPYGLGAVVSVVALLFLASNIESPRRFLAMNKAADMPDLEMRLPRAQLGAPAEKAAQMPPLAAPAAPMGQPEVELRDYAGAPTRGDRAKALAGREGGIGGGMAGQANVAPYAGLNAPAQKPQNFNYPAGAAGEKSMAKFGPQFQPPAEQEILRLDPVSNEAKKRELLERAPAASPQAGRKVARVADLQRHKGEAILDRDRKDAKLADGQLEQRGDKAEKELAASKSVAKGGAGGRMAGLPAMPRGEPAAAAEAPALRVGKVRAARRLQDGLDDAENQAEYVDPSTPPPPPLVVREYAHHHATHGPSEERSDFVDTVFWHPALVLADGKGEVSFDLCDSVTSYQVTVFGHTLDGRIGASTSTIESRLPFTLEPKLPIEVTANDKIDVPISIANNTNDARQVNIRVAASNLKLDGKTDEQLTINPDSRVRRLFRFQPTVAEGQATVRLEGKSDPFNDAVTRSFVVVPEGFPIVGSKSDLLENVAQHQVVLPETWVEGTLKCQVQVYPSTLADLQKGLESLLREPGGCFEQTSSSNYPNVVILDYLRESDQANPAVQGRARDMLARGYQKLVSFECSEPGQNRRQGYEWFGGAVPAHEALTAYGLLQFRDMARVYDVDKTMVERTRTYLMSRKDGKGGFLRNSKALDTFGRAPDDVTNAYIVWAITESSKDDDVTKELAALAEQAKTSKDPYFLSLVAISLINRDKLDDGTAILKHVSTAQKEDGHVDAGKTSITGSGGRDLEIETTALAVLGWLKANRPADFNMPVQKAIKWIGQQRGGYGGFGSTQSTILALKALIAYTKANKQTSEAGNLRLVVGDKMADQLNFQAGVQDALVVTVPDAEKTLKPGKNNVRVEITGKNHFPYTLSWSYQTRKPPSAEQYPVRLGTKLDRAAATEGETVHLSVTVENTQDKGQGMAVAVVGLPAGLTLPEDMKQLKDHARLRNDGKERALISAWETRGREVILYWRDLAPKQKIEVPIDLICRVPGEYRGPASRAYLYYTSDLKHWADPLTIKIAPKGD